MTTRVAIIDYGSGNLRSAAKAFEFAGADQVSVTDNPKDVLDADRIVLPGVGAFGDCRRGLYAVPGMVEALDKAVRQQGKPFFGICVGMQLMASVGLEFGSHEGLGWIAGPVTAIEPEDTTLKIPHMGWNQLSFRAEHPVLSGIPAGAYAYFVHSYHLKAEAETDVLATTDYGEVLTAIVGRENMIGTQFHPEKSQSTGLHLIGNFLRWKV